MDGVPFNHVAVLKTRPFEFTQSGFCDVWVRICLAYWIRATAVPVPGDPSSKAGEDLHVPFEDHEAHDLAVPKDENDCVDLVCLSGYTCCNSYRSPETGDAEILKSLWGTRESFTEAFAFAGTPLQAKTFVCKE